MSLCAVKTSVTAAMSVKTAAKAMSTTSAATYTERQARLGRPVSPHVTIYKFPITALASITNRACGVGLAAGFGAASALAAIGVDIPSAIYVAQDAIPGFTPLSKLLVVFPITYHTLNAARQMAWDANPKLINLVDAPKTSYGLVGAATVLSLGAAAYTIESPAKE